MPGMRNKSKHISWKHDGTDGKRIAKKQANKFERQQEMKSIYEIKSSGRYDFEDYDSEF